MTGKPSVPMAMEVYCPGLLAESRTEAVKEEQEMLLHLPNLRERAAAAKISTTDRLIM